MSVDPASVQSDASTSLEASKKIQASTVKEVYSTSTWDFINVEFPVNATDPTRQADQHVM